MEASKYCDKPGEGEGKKKKQDEIKAYVHQRCNKILYLRKEGEIERD